jgi:enamine deaminase RidA (YjgF/YER057c/UK114 family)
MDFCSFDCGKLPASVNISRFQGKSGTLEYNLIVRPTEYGSIETQLEWMEQAYDNALISFGLDRCTALLRRFFCSDTINQAAALRACSFSNPDSAYEPCAVSWVGQPSTPPAKVGLWAYHVVDPNSELDKTKQGTSLKLKRGKLSHYWTTGITSLDASASYDQTRGVFEEYDGILQSNNMTLSDNVMRTWLFIQNVDANYQGVVVARREFFAEHGLTPDTHFIASTGIEGAYVDPAARLSMDAYAIAGVQPEQVEYLSALDHLSPTHIYGVTFERGTAVSYQDRKHVIISGTASIDDQGQVLYRGDVSRQLDRTMENVESLLQSAGATLDDMSAFIVYVRDPGDLEVAWQQMRERFGDAPIEIVVAPVCRPGWLIEVEGIAIVPASNPELPAF